MSTKKLIKVSGVSEQSRDYYKLTIKDELTSKIDYVILQNPNIKEYCNKNNISLSEYEYSSPVYGWSELIGVIDSYITEFNYKYKVNEID